MGAAGDLPGVLAMIVITAGTTEYRAIIESQARKCAALGYSHRIFDLGGLGIGRPHSVEIEDLQPTHNGDSLPPATFKAGLLLDALVSEVSHGGLAMWMDADCVPLRSIIPYTAVGKYDAAVTLRPKSEIGKCGIKSMDFLNSGVVWIRNTPQGRTFAKRWSELSTHFATDQGALNELVAPEFGAKEWLQSVDGIVTTDEGAKVLVLNSMEWNCWHLPPGPMTRILHFKRGIRGSAVNYL